MVKCGAIANELVFDKFYSVINLKVPTHIAILFIKKKSLNLSGTNYEGCQTKCFL